MDKGFAKQLTERERIHHADHYHNYRHIKGPTGLSDDEVGGRESMRVRYNHGYDRKSFNENLNPLKSWVHSGLGKNWDKYYGELRKQFDARKVINNHILEHLFQYVEIHTFVGDKGQVMFIDSRYNSNGEQPIKKCYKDYYVCPKSGVLRATQKQPRRSIVKEQEANKLKADLSVRRQLDKSNVLHLIDGVWYHFELRPIPEATIVYDKPPGQNTFKTGYQYLGTPNSRREKTWNELNESERQRFGRPRVVGETARDLFTNEVVYRTNKGGKWSVHFGDRYQNYRRDRQSVELYHATKATASRKQLKLAGIV